MKKTDTLLKLVSALVFCAMTAYLALYIANRFVDPVQTALAVTATMSDSASMSGLVVRDELVIQSGAQYIDITARDGEKIAAGQAVAVAYDSEEALKRASRLTALEREMEDVRTVLSDAEGVQAASNRDRSVYDALRSISRAVRSESLAGIDVQSGTLAGLLFRTDGTDATEEYLQELETEYNELSAEGGQGAETITVAEGGTFSSLLDGFEGISPAYVREMYPDDLRQVIAAERRTEDGTIGKLITSYKWYYAAIADKSDAARLTEGATVKLSFGRYYSDYLAAKVEYIGHSQQDSQIVLFSMDRGFGDMLAVRAVSAEIIYSEYTGLRVPLKGLYRYYAGYVTPENGGHLALGSEATLTLGGDTYRVLVSELGSAQRYGDLPAEVEPGSEGDTRPSRQQVVLVWPWVDEPAPDLSDGEGKLYLDDGTMPITVTGYYEYDPEAETDRMCVFTMTGLQAERKKVELIYAGEEYALVSSQGDDALREGNEIIVRAGGLHDGKVFH